QTLRLLLVPIGKTPSIRRSGRARVATRPGMAQYVASLKVFAVGGLLKDKILGKMSVVVADVQTREKHFRRAHDHRPPVSALDPEDAEITQLVVRQRVSGTGIAPTHVPCVLEKHRTTILFFDLPAEQGLVEGGKLPLVLQVLGEVHVGWQ